MIATHIVLMIATPVSNLSLNTFAEILLKYHRLRNIDSKRKQTNVVCKRNLQKDILRKPKENCPGIERGGVIFTIRSETKKFVLALRSRYFNKLLFSNICILEDSQLLRREAWEYTCFESEFLSLWSFSICLIIEKRLPNLHIRYHIRSHVTSPATDKIYTIQKSKNHWAARNAEIKPMIGHSKNISKNIIRYW